VVWEGSRGRDSKIKIIEKEKMSEIVVKDSNNLQIGIRLPENHDVYGKPAILIFLDSDPKNNLEYRVNVFKRSNSLLGMSLEISKIISLELSFLFINLYPRKIYIINI
jgi:hypothetical protein